MIEANKQIKKDLVNQGLSQGKVFSVSEYIQLLNVVLKKCQAKIIGEVSQVKISRPGHIYFSLKDKNESGLIECVIWRYNYGLCGVELKEGLEVIVFGNPDIYAPWGKFQFKAETVEVAGKGKLKEEYEKLKKKLTEQGFFSKERKRLIPSCPKKIGVITSSRGAVIHDFNSNLKKFGFEVKLIDSLVEGQQAVKDLLLSIRLFRKQDIDVLVIMRGGGSLESLLGFNNEILVREVVNFPIPVIAGIGHDKDVSLVALAADVMVSTPTAAANILNQSWERVCLNINRHSKALIYTYSQWLLKINSEIKHSFYKMSSRLEIIFRKYRKIEGKLKISLSKIKFTISEQRTFLNDNGRLIIKLFSRLLSQTNKNIAKSWNKSLEPKFLSSFKAILLCIATVEKGINYNNPGRQLRLGYCIARGGGKIIKSVKSVKLEQEIDLQVNDGMIKSKVKNINKNKKNG